MQSIIEQSIIKINQQGLFFMGKGDKKTKRGKIFTGSYGKHRPRKAKRYVPAITIKDETVKDNEKVEEAESIEKKPIELKTEKKPKEEKAEKKPKEVKAVKKSKEEKTEKKPKEAKTAKKPKEVKTEKK